MTTEELKIIITAQTTQLNNQVKDVKKQMSDLAKDTEKHTGKISNAFGGIKKALGAIGIAMGAAKVISYLKEWTSGAIETEAQMSNLSRTMGEQASAFQSWAKNQASAFGISESAAIKYGNAYSNLISSFISDTAESTAYTKQLIEASAVIASKSGRTIEDVNSRIRSGLLGSTEAIEDLGINVNVGTLKMTQAFKDIANGRNWEQLTFYEQQQVRLFAIMEQSAQKFGTELGDNTATKMLIFQAKLDNLKLSIGRAFSPIVEYVIPVLTWFIDKLNVAVNYVTAFFGALGFGSKTKAAAENVSKTASAAGGVTKNLDNANKAAEKLKRTTAGFDEMQILSTGTSSGASGADTGAAAGGGVSAGPTMSIGVDVEDNGAEGKIAAIAQKVKDKVAETADKIKTAFAPSITAWGTAFEDLKTKASGAFDSAKQTASDLWNNTLSPFGGYILTDFIPNISNSFSETFAPIFSDVLGFAFDEAATDFDFLCKQVDRAAKDVFQPAMDLIKTVATDAMESVKEVWDEKGQEILDKLGKVRDKLKEIWDSIYNKIIKPIIDNVINKVTELWNEHLKPLWDELAAFFASITDYLLTYWNTILLPVIQWLVDKLGPIITNLINRLVDNIKNGFGFISDVIKGVVKTLRGLLDFFIGIFTGDWKKAWEGIKTSVKGVWDAIWATIKYIINLIIDAVNSLWKGVYKVVKGIVDAIGGVAGALGNLIGKDWKFSMSAEPPLIPRLATGGIVTRSTIANIGEAGREAVLPLENNTGWMDILAQKINGSGPTKIVLNIDGKQFATTTVKSLNDLARANGGLQLKLA